MTRAFSLLIISFCAVTVLGVAGAVAEPSRIYWSATGRNLGLGNDIRYFGGSPITAMVLHNGGVLTAFTNAGPNGYRVHWSPNGQNLGSGPPVYDGSSPVTAMIPYKGGF